MDLRLVLLMILLSLLTIQAPAQAATFLIGSAMVLPLVAVFYALMIDGH